MRKLLMSLSIVAMVLAAAPLSGCSRPEMPSMTGPGKFRDIGQVRKGMSPNEVQRIMGPNHKVLYEEGLQGMDGGNYIWDYPEGRIYIGMEGVTRVVPVK